MCLIGEKSGEQLKAVCGGRPGAVWLSERPAAADTLEEQQSGGDSAVSNFLTTKAPQGPSNSLKAETTELRDGATASFTVCLDVAFASQLQEIEHELGDYFACDVEGAARSEVGEKLAGVVYRALEF